MRLLILSGNGNSGIIESNFVPRIGDKVDMFYKPFPTVTHVLCWPSDDLLASRGTYVSSDIDAIITVN